jgi:hypothetical protein
MNKLLEKARRDYTIGTKIKSLYKDVAYIVSANTVIRNENVCTIDENRDIRCIYDKSLNEWAEIIKQETMTQQEFNDLKVGDFINNYEILHKYKEFLIVRCEDGHDLFDLAKINKLGLKITPKTFMGLEVKKYDNVPCEIGGNSLVYLAEVRIDDVLIRTFKFGSFLNHIPISIRII